MRCVGATVSANRVILQGCYDVSPISGQCESIGDDTMGQIWVGGSAADDLIPACSASLLASLYAPSRLFSNSTVIVECSRADGSIVTTNAYAIPISAGKHLSNNYSQCPQRG